MKNTDCKIHYNSEYVSWYIPKETIEKTLIGTKTNKGLLYLNNESAGKIKFINDSCFVNDKNDKVCNKIMKNELEYKKGNADSVRTPLSIVNFHTHPLSCYIAAECVWGWPSGEDLAVCLDFANNNNLTHIIFAVEGTYVIDVNKDLLYNYLKLNKLLLRRTKKNVEEMFKLTHKHRMFYNDDDPDTSLEYEFDNVFLLPIGLTPQKNILYSWLNLVNNLTLTKFLKPAVELPERSIIISGVTSVILILFNH